MSHILKNQTLSDINLDIGRVVPASGSLEIDAPNLFAFQKSNDVLTKLANGDLVLNDGVKDLGLSSALDHLKGFFPVTPIDTDTGMPSVSTKKLPNGWYPELREIEFETSKLNSIHDKDSSDVDIGEHSLKFLDDNMDELVSPSQATLDTDCRWTIVTFDPSRDWAIRGAYTRQIAIPSSPLYVWNEFKILIDPAPVYMVLPYANGGLNMEFQDVRQSVGDEGENYSFFTSNDSIIWKIQHNAGFKHRIRVIYQLALGVGS